VKIQTKNIGFGAKFATKKYGIKKMKIIEYDGFDGTAYYSENLVCSGCQKEFCFTVKVIEDGERFCKICFNHRFGYKDMNEIIEKLDEMGNYLWETTSSEIKPEIRKKLHWIKKSMANK